MTFPLLSVHTQNKKAHICGKNELYACVPVHACVHTRLSVLLHVRA